MRRDGCAFRASEEEAKMEIIYVHKFAARAFEERLRQAEWERLVEEVATSQPASAGGQGPRLSRALAALNPALRLAYWPSAC
jgi:hypothetical protein